MTQPPPAESPHEDEERAVEETAGFGLFGAGGAFSRYPGAVLVVGRNGLVLAANQAAEGIAALLQGGGSEDLRVAIDSALEGRAAQLTPLILPPPLGTGGTGQAFDLAVLPWSDGTAALLVGRDITLERGRRAALVAAHARNRNLLEAAGDFLWETDDRGRFTMISERGALGYGAAELTGRSALDLHLDPVEPAESPFATRIPLREAEIWLRGADERPVCLAIAAIPLVASDGTWRGACGLCRDVTESRGRPAVPAERRGRDRLLAYVLGLLRDELEPARMLEVVAATLVPALGASAVAIYRRGPGGALELEAEAGRRPGAERSARLLDALDEAQHENEFSQSDPAGLGVALATRCRDERNGALVVWRPEPHAPFEPDERHLMREIAEQIGLAHRQLARRDELDEHSARDPLTGLLNRRGFLEMLDRRYPQVPTGPGPGALFHLDLDNFRLVNEHLGHPQGDLALRAAARILHEQSRTHDPVARLGGDDFALFIADITGAAAEHKAQALLAAGAELAAYSGDPAYPLGFSIGVALCDPARRESRQDLLERARGAVEGVKRRGMEGLSIVPAPGAGAAA